MKKIYLQITFLIPAIYAYSYFLISNYTFGDQVYYRSMYEAFYSAEFLDVLETAEYYIIASDPLSFYILWAGAYLGIEKDVFISAFNTAFLLGIYILARRYRASYLMIFLIFTNFYVIVLMTGAERLKFAFLFLFLAAIFNKNRNKAMLLIASLFSHLQSIILLAAIFSGSFVERIISEAKNKIIKKSTLISVLFILIASIYFITFNFNNIEAKAKDYISGDFFIGGLIQIILFSAAGIYFIENKLKFALAMLPLFIAILFIGSDRVNMIAVMLGVYLYWMEDKANHPYMYLLMAYFSIKSFGFISNILNHGNGFYGA